MKRAVILLLMLLPALVWAGGRQEQTTGGGPFEGKRIRVMSDQRGEIAKMKELVVQWEAETGAKVEFVELGEQPLDEKASLELSAPSTNLDISFLKFFYTRDYANRGFLQPLNDLISSPEAWKLWSQTGLDVAKVDGKYHGVPHYMEPNILTFRADLFQKYGLSVPQTMDELKAAARTIHQQEPNVSGIAARANRKGRPNWDWSSFLHAYGGKYMDDQGRPTVNTPQAVAALEMYTDLLTNYGPPGVADYNWQDVQDSLAGGRVGIMYDAVGLAMRVTNPDSPVYVKDIADRLGFALVPKGPVKREGGFFTWFFVMPRNSRQENKEAAMALIEWAFSPEIAIKIGWGTHGVGDTFDVDGYSGYAQSGNLLQVYRETLNYTSPDYRPLIPELTQLMDIVDIAINSAVAGLKSPRAALDQAQKELEEIF